MDKPNDNTINKRFQAEVRYIAHKVAAIDRIKLRESNHRFKILIAEDDPTCSKVFRILLEERFKYRCEQAINGKIALEKYKEGGFDLIFMDTNMPIMTGIETTLLIREHEKTTGNHITIIGQTGYGEFAANDCYAAGMDAVIVKDDMIRFELIESLLVWFLHENHK